MRALLLGCVVPTLAVAGALGQSAVTQSATIHLANGETAQDLQEIIQTLSAVGDIRQVSIDSPKTGIAVSGTADQLAFARWLIGEFDRPPSGPVPVNSVKHEYKLQDGIDDVVRVFYLGNCESLEDIQGVMTSVRTVTDFRSVFPYSGQRALTVRGTVADILLAAWVVNELDKPAAEPLPMNSSGHEYKLQSGGEDVVRVLFMHSGSYQDLQEVMIAIRSMGNIRRLFPLSSRRVLTARGTAAQMAMAKWLVNELDKPVRAQSSAVPGPLEYLMPGETSGVVRLFYFPTSLTTKELNDIMLAIHSATRTWAVFPISAQKAMVVRGTASQVATAERVINDHR